MNKTELIERIAQEAEVTTSEAQRHFDVFEPVVTETLKDTEEVRIAGFGKSPCGSAEPGREGISRQARRWRLQLRGFRPSARATPSRRPSRSFGTQIFFGRGNDEAGLRP